MITKEQTNNGTEFRADGHLLCSITTLTEPSQVDHFDALCNLHSEEITDLANSAAERRQWNIDNPNEGKDWPVFRKLERLINRLCLEAGIKDT